MALRILQDVDMSYTQETSPSMMREGQIVGTFKSCRTYSSAVIDELKKHRLENDVALHTAKAIKVLQADHKFQNFQIWKNIKSSDFDAKKPRNTFFELQQRKFKAQGRPSMFTRFTEKEKPIQNRRRNKTRGATTLNTTLTVNMKAQLKGNINIVNGSYQTGPQQMAVARSAGRVNSIKNQGFQRNQFLNTINDTTHVTNNELILIGKKHEPVIQTLVMAGGKNISKIISKRQMSNIQSNPASGLSSSTKKTRYNDQTYDFGDATIESPAGIGKAEQNKFKNKVKKSEDVVGLLDIVEKAVNADSKSRQKKKGNHIVYKQLPVSTHQFDEQIDNSSQNSMRIISQQVLSKKEQQKKIKKRRKSSYQSPMAEQDPSNVSYRQANSSCMVNENDLMPDYAYILDKETAQNQQDLNEDQRKNSSTTNMSNKIRRGDNYSGEYDMDPSKRQKGNGEPLVLDLLGSQYGKQSQITHPSPMLPSAKNGNNMKLLSSNSKKSQIIVEDGGETQKRYINPKIKALQEDLDISPTTNLNIIRYDDSTNKYEHDGNKNVDPLNSPSAGSIVMTNSGTTTPILKKNMNRVKKNFEYNKDLPPSKNVKKRQDEQKERDVKNYNSITQFNEFNQQIQQSLSHTESNEKMIEQLRPQVDIPVSTSTGVGLDTTMINAQTQLTQLLNQKQATNFGTPVHLKALQLSTKCSIEHHKERYETPFVLDPAEVKKEEPKIVFLTSGAKNIQVKKKKLNEEDPKMFGDRIMSAQRSPYLNRIKKIQEVKIQKEVNQVKAQMSQIKLRRQEINIRRRDKVAEKVNGYLEREHINEDIQYGQSINFQEGMHTIPQPSRTINNRSIEAGRPSVSQKPITQKTTLSEGRIYQSDIIKIVNDNSPTRMERITKYSLNQALLSNTMSQEYAKTTEQTIQPTSQPRSLASQIRENIDHQNSINETKKDTLEASTLRNLEDQRASKDSKEYQQRVQSFNNEGISFNQEQYCKMVRKIAPKSAGNSRSRHHNTQNSQNMQTYKRRVLLQQSQPLMQTNTQSYNQAIAQNQMGYLDGETTNSREVSPILQTFQISSGDKKKGKSQKEFSMVSTAAGQMVGNKIIKDEYSQVKKLNKYKTIQNDYCLSQSSYNVPKIAKEENISRPMTGVAYSLRRKCKIFRDKRNKKTKEDHYNTQRLDALNTINFDDRADTVQVIYRQNNQSKIQDLSLLGRSRVTTEFVNAAYLKTRCFSPIATKTTLTYQNIQKNKNLQLKQVMQNQQALKMEIQQDEGSESQDFQEEPITSMKNRKKSTTIFPSSHGDLEFGIDTEFLKARVYNQSNVFRKSQDPTSNECRISRNSRNVTLKKTQTTKSGAVHTADVNTLIPGTTTAAGGAELQIYLQDQKPSSRLQKKCDKKKNFVQKNADYLFNNVEKKKVQNQFIHVISTEIMTKEEMEYNEKILKIRQKKQMEKLKQGNKSKQDFKMKERFDSASDTNVQIYTAPRNSNYDVVIKSNPRTSQRMNSSAGGFTDKDRESLLINRDSKNQTQQIINNPPEANGSDHGGETLSALKTQEKGSMVQSYTEIHQKSRIQRDTENKSNLSVAETLKYSEKNLTKEKDKQSRELGLTLVASPDQSQVVLADSPMPIEMTQFIVIDEQDMQKTPSQLNQDHSVIMKDSSPKMLEGNKSNIQTQDNGISTFNGDECKKQKRKNKRDSQSDISSIKPNMNMEVVKRDELKLRVKRSFANKFNDQEQFAQAFVNGTNSGDNIGIEAQDFSETLKIGRPMSKVSKGVQNIQVSFSHTTSSKTGLNDKRTAEKDAMSRVDEPLSQSQITVKNGLNCVEDHSELPVVNFNSKQMRAIKSAYRENQQQSSFIKNKCRNINQSRIRHVVVRSYVDQKIKQSRLDQKKVQQKSGASTAHTSKILITQKPIYKLKANMNAYDQMVNSNHNQAIEVDTNKNTYDTAPLLTIADITNTAGNNSLIAGRPSSQKSQTINVDIMDIMHNNQLNKSLNAFMISDNIGMFAPSGGNIQTNMNDLTMGPGLRNRLNNVKTKKHSDDVNLISSMSGSGVVAMQNKGNILDAIALEQTHSNNTGH